MADGKLLLMPLARCGLEFLRGLRNDPAIAEYLFSDPGYISQERQEAWWRDYLRDKDSLIFIAHLPSWTRIGYAQATHIDNHNCSCEAGFYISPSYQNQGYGTALVEQFLEIAHKIMCLHRVELRVFADNARAIHVYEKAGFVSEGLLRDAVMKAGKYRDVVIMAHIAP